MMERGSERCDPCWLWWRWRKGEWSKECRLPPKAEKGKKIDSLLVPPENNAVLPTPLFELSETCVRIWPTELWDSTFVSFEATKFVALCYDSNRKKKCRSWCLEWVIALTNNVEWLWNWAVGRGWKNFEKYDRKTLGLLEYAVRRNGY